MEDVLENVFSAAVGGSRLLTALLPYSSLESCLYLVCPYYKPEDAGYLQNPLRTWLAAFRFSTMKNSNDKAVHPRSRAALLHGSAALSG